VQAHVEQVLAVDRLLNAVIRDVVADAGILEGYLVYSTGTELKEVRYVHLLDIAIQDELKPQVMSEVCQGGLACLPSCARSEAAA